MIEKYFVQGEGEYVIPYLLMIPEESNGKALIYLHPSGKAAEAREGGEMEWFVRKGYTVLAPDLIGTGELGEGGSSELRREWRASILIARSIVGIRAGDLARLTTVLQNQVAPDEIHALARREAAPALLHAAAFVPRISAVALVEPLLSYRSVVLNRFYDTGLVHVTVAGALTAYDLPDLAAALAPRRVMMACVMDGTGCGSTSESSKEEFDYIQRAFHSVGASDQFLQMVGCSCAEPDELFEAWIN